MNDKANAINDTNMKTNNVEDTIKNQKLVEKWKSIKKEQCFNLEDWPNEEEIKVLENHYEMDSNCVWRNVFDGSMKMEIDGDKFLFYPYPVPQYEVPINLKDLKTYKQILWWVRVLTGRNDMLAADLNKFIRLCCEHNKLSC